MAELSRYRTSQQVLVGAVRVFNIVFIVHDVKFNTISQILCYNDFMEHIAILRQPFFDMVLTGEKTIESRWSLNRIAPYKRVEVGDLIYLKDTGKCVTAKAVVKRVKFYQLTPSLADEIKRKYGDKIGIDRFKNWRDYRYKHFCTLIWLGNVQTIPPKKVKRSNGAGWIVVK